MVLFGSPAVAGGRLLRPPGDLPKGARLFGDRAKFLRAAVQQDLSQNDSLQRAVVAADTTLLLAGELQQQWCPDPGKAQQLELQTSEAQKLAQEAGRAGRGAKGAGKLMARKELKVSRLPCLRLSASCPWARWNSPTTGSPLKWMRPRLLPWWPPSAPGGWTWSSITSISPCRASGPRPRAGSRTWRPGLTASGPGWSGPGRPGSICSARSIATFPRCCAWTLRARRPLALMHLGLTNVPAIKRLPPLVAKLGAAGDSGSADPTALIPGQEMGGAWKKSKNYWGWAPRWTDDAVATRMLEVLGDLAAALKLPPEASVSQITGALAALQAGEASLRESTAELAALKARLAAEAEDKAVGAALQAGKISPAQKGWALEYFRQDPEGFATYVARAPKTVPLGDLLSLQGEERSPVAALAPEELDICRSLNLAPEKYLAAKDQTASRPGGSRTALAMGSRQIVIRQHCLTTGH